MLTESHLFYVPPTITERAATHDVLVGPAAATFDEAPDIRFEIAPSTDLISLADMRFECELYLFKRNGQPMDDQQNACPKNNMLGSLFQSVTVEIAGRCISDPSNLYFIRSYLENLLGYSREAQNSQLTSEGFFYQSKMIKDNLEGSYTAGPPALHTFPNEDQTLRWQLFKQSSVNPVLLSGKIHSDIFQQDKPLIPGVPLSIKFTRARPGVGYTAASDDDIPKVVIRKPRLFVRKYEPSSSYLSALQKHLATAPAVYHFERVQMRQTTLNQDATFCDWPNVAAGQLPKMMLITMVSSNALAGTHNTTPYHFEDFGLNYLNAEIDGKIYPSQGYNMDFETHQTLPCYDGLCRVLEVFNETTKGLPFNRNEYEQGNNIFGFDFTPSGTSRGALTLIRQGNLNINLRFKAPLKKSIVIIAYLVYDSTVSINTMRQVAFDYSP